MTARPSADLHPTLLRSIPVQGMTCAACSARIQRVLERTPGVSAANVNLMTGSATVSYDPSSVTPERLVEAIRDTGYGAELPAPDASAEDLVDAQDAARDDEIRDLRRKLIAESRRGGARRWCSACRSRELVGRGVADPLMPLMMPLTDLLRRVAPWIDRVSADTWRWLLLALTAPGGGVGRAALLHPGLGRVPAPQRRHEHAHRRRHRRRLRLQRGRDAGGRLVQRPRHRAARLLRGGGLDHRPDPARATCSRREPRAAPPARSAG